MVKNLPANAGDTRDEGSIPGLGRFPGVGNGYPLQYSCLENPKDKRNLAGYSSRSRKELDTIEVTWHAHSEGINSKESPQTLKTQFPRCQHSKTFSLL